MSHGVSIKMGGSDLAMRMGFKENEILHGFIPIVSPFVMNMKRYTALYVYTDIIQNQLVGDVRASLLRVVPAKSRYGDKTCVTYEQLSSFLWVDPTFRQTEVHIRSDTGELVLFESGKSIVTLVFRIKLLFHGCIDYQHLKGQHVKEVMVLAVSSKG